MVYRLQSLLGVVVLLGIGFALSKRRRAIRPRTILWGMALQFTFACLILKTGPGLWLFDLARDIVLKIMSFSTMSRFSCSEV